MSTINEVIARVDDINPSPYSDSVKARWLIALDGRIFADTMHNSGATPPSRFPRDGDLPLIVPPPYDGLYDLYIYAMVDFHNREIDNFNNSSQLFNAALDEFKSHYHHTNIPPSANFRNVL